MSCRSQFLRHLKEFFQVNFKVENKKEELGEESDRNMKEPDLTRAIVTLSCVGVGYSNFSKGIM